MKAAKNIEGLNPLSSEDIEQNKFGEEEVKVNLLRTVEEYFTNEFGFRIDQVHQMDIKKVFRSRNKRSQILYVQFQESKPVSHIFRRSSMIKNNKH